MSTTVLSGAHTIAWHLEHHHQVKVSPATIWRRLRDAGLITEQPKKRPNSSYIRFQADQSNETWQSDMHWRLADRTDVEILTFLDDHARYALSVPAHARVTAPIVVGTFTRTAETHGIPASVLWSCPCRVAGVRNDPLRPPAAHPSRDRRGSTHYLSPTPRPGEPDLP